MNGGTIIPRAYTNFQPPPRCFNTRRAAAERVYALPFSRSTNEFRPGEPGSGSDEPGAGEAGSPDEPGPKAGSPAFRTNSCPAELCRDAKRNLPSGSLLMMNCTLPLQRLQTPSKRTTRPGLTDRGAVPPGGADFIGGSASI